MKRIGRHINPATILALVALVFAVTGGAYAASSSGVGSHATASVAKSKKSKKKSSSGKPGPRGPAGAAGSVGPAGPVGPAGAKGDAGAAGASGASGEPGAPGEKGAAGTAGQSVASVTEPPGAHCENGGYKLTSAGGTQYVCNGQNGADGQSGFTETLPAGQTEQGAFSFDRQPLGPAAVTISFNIPLAAELPEANVHFIPAGGTVPAACEGGSAAHPKAKSGNLCVFSSIEVNGAFEGIEKVAGFGGGANTSGALIAAELTESPVFFSGTWAVTG